MASDSVINEWGEISDDAQFVYQALARLDFQDFSVLTTADQSLVLGLALHLKRLSQRTITLQS